MRRKGSRAEHGQFTAKAKQSQLVLEGNERLQNRRLEGKWPCLEEGEHRPSFVEN